MAYDNKFRDISTWFDYNVDPHNRVIYLGDTNKSGVDARMAEEAIKGLFALDNAASDSTITIVLNTTGGDFAHGLAIYDVIRGCRNHINIIVIGQCYSMGAVILQAADTRIMTPNSTMMVHYGETWFGGHPETARRWGVEDKRLGRWMEKMFLRRIREKHPNYRLKDVKELLKFDSIMTAQQALKLGLIDAIHGEILDETN